MDDLISRQAVFDELKGLYIAPPKITNDMVWDSAIDTATDKVKDLPSAQKKGHWIDGSCSVCGCDEPIFIEDWNVEHCKTPFCPICGADMGNYED